MNIAIRKVSHEDKSVLYNLMQLYLYDMSQFTNADLSGHGLFEYKYLDNYWTELGRHPFFIEADGHLAGFVLVNRFSLIVEKANSIAEFFVMKKYRLQGVGEHAAVYLFNFLPGTWEVRELGSNVVAQSFWRKVIRQYTNDDYQECILNDERWNGPIQTFQSRSGNI